MICLEEACVWIPPPCRGDAVVPWDAALKTPEVSPSPLACMPAPAIPGYFFKNIDPIFYFCIYYKCKLQMKASTTQTITQRSIFPTAGLGLNSLWLICYIITACNRKASASTVLIL